MNPLPLFLIIVTLPLLLGGCEKKHYGVNTEGVELRDGIAYLKGSYTPYKGKIYELYKNGRKLAEGNYKDGKQEGLTVAWHENGLKAAENNWNYGKQEGLAVGWHENGLKAGESDWKDGKKISSKYWNNKGEPVDTYEEAIK